MKNKSSFYEVKKFFGRLDNTYNKFIDYFDKNWYCSKFINFDSLNQKEYMYRTNNYIENFHKQLNDSINGFHPKLSYLAEKLKEFTIKGYHVYIESIVNNKEEKYEKYSVINDILNFIMKYNKKYGSTFNANIIIQGEGETIADIDNLCKKVLELLYDVEGGKNELNEKEEILDESKANNILDIEKEISEFEENEPNKNDKTEVSKYNNGEIDSIFIDEFNDDENICCYGKKKKSFGF